jgi:hypothetical protein
VQPDKSLLGLQDCCELCLYAALKRSEAAETDLRLSRRKLVDYAQRQRAQRRP